LFLTQCVTRKWKFVDIKENFKGKFLIMADKKLHKSYTKDIKSLQVIDLNSLLDKVIIEWE
tara:strand:- start:32 stop:214 length:183 start_codon:yes stop_codon:yes gene_type:complete